MSKPPPFKRASIDMDRHGRVWKFVEAKDLRKDDVVKDQGLVVVVSLYEDNKLSLMTGGFSIIKEVHVGYVNGNMDYFKDDELVFAFVKREK